MRILHFTLALFTFLNIFGQSDRIASPDGSINVTVGYGDQLTYSLEVDGKSVISPSALSITVDNQKLGAEPRKRRIRRNEVNNTLHPRVWYQNEIIDHYNEAIITFRGRYVLIVRVYNDGFAYRLSTDLRDNVIVNDEQFEVKWAEDYTMIVSHPRTGEFQHSYEDFYIEKPVSGLSQDSLIMLPALVADDDLFVGFTEADLIDYPASYLKKGSGRYQLVSAHPAFPLEESPGGHRDLNMRVDRYADHIAETSGKREFPWRVFIIEREARDLLTNDLVYRISRKEDPDIDFTWVKPGKVAWDWWNAMNLRGVDFETGVNNETYKYFIDFAAENGLEYINIDEGWSELFDLTAQTDNIDVEEVINYAKSRNVDVFLWCVARTLNAQLEEAMDQFTRWGVKGLKIDFMDRDDQKMVNFYYRISEAAAKNKIHLNFHGAYKPTGMYRQFPNVLNREAVRGLEYNKFAEPNGTTPGHALKIPFIRMLGGYLDYTPGAMVNANKQDFRVIFDQPMSQGTRCHQLAMFIVYFGPLQMLSDAPTKYQEEPEILEYIASVPTIWDESIPLAGDVGELAAIARRKGDVWYVGAMTGWSGRSVNIRFDFLDPGDYEMQLFRDGINADRVGEDYIKVIDFVNNKSELQIDMAPGGGAAIKLTPVNR